MKFVTVISFGGTSAETGLCYNQFRYYESESGSYISQDPIGLASGEPNFYAYVSDPNGWVDVFGLDGIIYIRTDRRTKKEYIGESKNPDTYEKRKKLTLPKLKKQILHILVMSSLN